MGGATLPAPLLRAEVVGGMDKCGDGYCSMEELYDEETRTQPCPQDCAPLGRCTPFNESDISAYEWWHADFTRQAGMYGLRRSPNMTEVRLSAKGFGDFVYTASCPRESMSVQS